MWAVAILVAERICYFTFKREGLPAKTLESAFVWIVLGTFIGARVGHCLLYDPLEYLADPIRILDVREGGMASHGATIGILLGIYIFSRRNHLPFIWGVDRIAIVAPLSGAIIRMGNLFNSEIVGRPTDLPWGFQFPRCSEDRMLDMLGQEIPARHPAQIYEALCYLLTFGIILYLYYGKDLGRRRPGFLFGVAMIGIFVSRFVIEFCKEPQPGEMLDWFGLDHGQLYSIPFILIGVYMIIRAMIRPAVTDVNAVVENSNRLYNNELKRKGNRK
jgi:prolipoprotein diacylglyceryl transferase